MNIANKQELYELIDACDNEMLLAEVKDLLKSSAIKDWWDEGSTIAYLILKLILIIV